MKMQGGSGSGYAGEGFAELMIGWNRGEVENG